MNTGINALYGRQIVGVEGFGVRLEDSSGLVSDVYSCDRLKRLIFEFGTSTVVTATATHMHVRGQDGRFIAVIPGDQLDSSTAKLWQNRRLNGRQAEFSANAVLNRR